MSRWREGGWWEESNREGEDPVAPPPIACLRPPCRAQGTPLPSGQLQLVIHHGDLGGERNTSRTSRDPEDWGGDGGGGGGGHIPSFLPRDSRWRRKLETELGALEEC